MTNHHCVVVCLEQISTQEQNFAGIGYSATPPAEERKCPDFELDQLVEIRDVTKKFRPLRPARPTKRQKQSSACQRG